MTQKQMEHLYSLALMLIDERDNPDLRAHLLVTSNTQLHRLNQALNLAAQPEDTDTDVVERLFHAVCRTHNLNFPTFFTDACDLEDYLLCHTLN
jgi:hypothetical protein